MKKNKFIFIIDSYPSSDEDKIVLLNNIKRIKSEGIDILLTSHHTCSSDIIENVDYFLFEKSNNYYYLDSDVLNNDLSNLKDPVFMRYYTAGETFIDRSVVTGWSVSITSQFFNAVNFLKSKGYDYAFYLISDFVYPDSGFSRILNSVDFNKNYLIKNSDNFSSWFAPFFFGFKIDNDLLSKMPNEDLSSLEVYQKYFTNCSFEDVIKNTFSGLQNDVHEFQKLDDIFGSGNWNTNKSTIQKGPASLHYCTSSSVYVNPDSEDNKFCLFLYQTHEYNSSISMNIKVFDIDTGDVIYNTQKNFYMGMWYKEYLDPYFVGRRNIRIEKELIDLNDNSIVVRDSVFLDINNIEKYSVIKKFQK